MGLNSLIKKKRVTFNSSTSEKSKVSYASLFLFFFTGWINDKHSESIKESCLERTDSNTLFIP